MESPPAYTPPPTQTPRKKNTGLIVAIVVGAIILCCVAPIGLMMAGGLWAFRQAMPMAECGMAMVDVRDAIVRYAEQNNQMPPAENWQTVIAEHYQPRSSDQRGPFTAADVAQPLGCSPETGIAYNATIAGRPLAEAREELNRVVLFEIETREMHAARPYEPLDPQRSPRFVGNMPRGWIVIGFTGEPSMLTPDGRRQTLNVGTN
jgi:hypothetical protein